MKTLLLFRHAKSDWEAEFEHDSERPLNKRGKRAAWRMGKHLASVGCLPDLVISSPAVRAVKTIELAVEAGGWDCEVAVEDDLYEADTSRVVALIQRQPDARETILLAGHEPAFSDTASLLIGGGELRMPTAAVACIEFDVDRWSEVKPPGGRLAWLVTPKLIEDAS